MAHNNTDISKSLSKEEHQKEVLFTPEMLALVSDLTDKVKTVEDSWQASDYLPDFSKSGWENEIRDLQKRTAGISDEIIMSLVGNTITEEALPSYHSWFNKHLPISDFSGTDDHPWARWIRTWSSEENKHGDLLNKYLDFSGRVDMKAMEISIGQLIRNGFNTQGENDPYHGIVFTSFQERGTKISHQNTAKFAKKAGDDLLSKACKIVAADEAKHERVYQTIMNKVLDLDPDGGILAFQKVMKDGVVMPAKELSGNEFQIFSEITQNTGIYTSNDYVDIMKYLIEKWNIENRIFETDNGKKAQEWLIQLPSRYEKLALRKAKAPKKLEESRVLWAKKRYGFNDLALNN